MFDESNSGRRAKQLGHDAPNAQIAAPHLTVPNTKIYNDLESLRQRGLVVIDVGENVRTFAVTAMGLEHAAKIRPLANEKALNYLSNVVDWVTSLNFSQLVRAIYAKYPQYKANSVFTG